MYLAWCEVLKEERDRACPQEDGSVMHWGVATLRAVKSTPLHLMSPEAPQARPPPDCGQSSVHLLKNSITFALHSDHEDLKR